MSIIIQNFLYNFNKKYFDLKQPNIKLMDFHPQIPMILVVNGLFFKNKRSRLRLIWPITSIVISIIATTFELTTMCHAFMTDDSELFTQCFAYGFIIAVVPFFYMAMAKNSDKIYALVESMDGDFRETCSLGDPYQSKFLKGQLRIWQCGYIWMVFVVIVAILYILLSVVALMYYSLFATQDEISRRPFVFPVWLPNVDPQQSPLYEILMAIMYLAIAVFVSTFTTYVYVVFHLLLHCYFLMDMVLIGINTLFDNIDESSNNEQDQMSSAKTVLQKRIQRIVNFQNGVYRLVFNTLEAYGVVMAYQIIFSAMVLCVMTYYITVQIEKGSFDICITLLNVGALLQLWIPCYLGSLLRTKGFELADACFYSGWHLSRYGSIVRVDLQLIILRLQKPVTIQVTPLPVLQLETFSSIMSTAYSYFNMLQQK